MEDKLRRLSNIGIVPVVKINAEEESLPLAKALKDGGIDCMEITFRSNHTIHAIKVITENMPEILVGAGTVANVEQAKEAVKAGASFIVTPGLNIPVIEWCIQEGVLIIPGVATPTEIETALSYGLHNLKLFPAETMGGAKFIKDISGPYPQVRIMPTGGISTANMHDYLKLKNVIAIGGSFMLPNDVILAQDWASIEALSKDAVKSLLDITTESITLNLDSSLNSVLPMLSPQVALGKDTKIELSTPYLSRSVYHLGKDNTLNVEEGSVKFETNEATVILRERG